VNTSFYSSLRGEVSKFGGYHNAHLHLDRAYTLDNGFVDSGKLQVLENSHISLQKKHALIATVHEGPAYSEDNLRKRLQLVTNDLINKILTIFGVAKVIP